MLYFSIKRTQCFDYYHDTSSITLWWILNLICPLPRDFYSRHQNRYSMFLKPQT